MVVIVYAGTFLWISLVNRFASITWNKDKPCRRRVWPRNSFWTKNRMWKNRRFIPIGETRYAKSCPQACLFRQVFALRK